MEQQSTFVGLAVALAAGLLIGLERGWTARAKDEGRRVAGLRTYGLLGLLGGVTSLLAKHLGVALLGFAFVAIAGVLAAVYIANLRRAEDTGITSLVAALLTFAFGALAVLGFTEVAASCAVVTAMLLGWKPELHRWLAALEGEELRAALTLLLISVVLLPILPDRGYGPWAALNPYELWWMVVLIAAIQFGGYFAMKLAGPQRGIVLTSLFAGLSSSTAATLYFARAARRSPGQRMLLAAGILIACGTMFPRMVVLAALIHRALFAPLLAPAAVMAACTYLPCLLILLAQRDDAAGEPTAFHHPLSLRTALQFGALLAAIVLLAAALQALAGDRGLYMLAAVSGVMDVDALTLSVSRMSRGDVVVQVAAGAILVAAAVNSVTKAGLAAGIGGRSLWWPVAAPLILAAAAGIGAHLLL